VNVLRQDTKDLQAVHVGHGQIEHHEGDPVAATQESQGFDAIARSDRMMPMHFEQLAQRLTDDIVIIHHEDDPFDDPFLGLGCYLAGFHLYPIGGVALGSGASGRCRTLCGCPAGRHDGEAKSAIQQSRLFRVRTRTTNR
jgi:hypothetical protein